MLITKKLHLKDKKKEGSIYIKSFFFGAYNALIKNKRLYLIVKKFLFNTGKDEKRTIYLTVSSISTVCDLLQFLKIIFFFFDIHKKKIQIY